MSPLPTSRRRARSLTYATDYLDRETGCANALHFVNARGQDVVVAANREIDEVALYTIGA